MFHSVWWLLSILPTYNSSVGGELMKTGDALKTHTYPGFIKKQRVFQTTCSLYQWNLRVLKLMVKRAPSYNEP